MQKSARKIIASIASILIAACFIITNTFEAKSEPRLTALAGDWTMILHGSCGSGFYLSFQLDALGHSTSAKVHGYGCPVKIDSMNINFSIPALNSSGEGNAILTCNSIDYSLNYYVCGAGYGSSRTFKIQVASGGDIFILIEIGLHTKLIGTAIKSGPSIH